MTIFRKLIVFLGILLLAAGCAANDEAPATIPSAGTNTTTPETAIPSIEATSLVNTSWHLESMGPAGEEMGVMGDTEITLMFSADEGASGMGGCNSYSTTYTIDGNNLQFGDVVSTLMACTDEVITNQEQQYFAALNAATNFELTENQLTIHYQSHSGEGVLNFAPRRMADDGAEQLSEQAQTYIDLSIATLAQGLRLPAEQIELESITTPATEEGVYIIVLRAENQSYEYHGSEGEVSLVSEPLPSASESIEIDLELDGRVATAVSSEVITAATSTNNQDPYWAVYPDHTELSFSSYAHDESLQVPKVYVYPVAEFIKVNDAAAAEIDQLTALLQERPDLDELTNTTLPFLPLVNAEPLMLTDKEYLEFSAGSGIRYLTQQGQDSGPINNQELFYTFQGLTDDGAYYVAAVLPVAQADLPADLTSAETVFPDGFDQYVQDVETHLATVADSSFTPDLLLLDTAVQSIVIDTE